MLTVGLFPNTKKQGVATVLDWLIHFLQENKVNVRMPAEAAAIMEHPELGRSREVLGAEHAVGGRAADLLRDAAHPR